jgi:hypothetical protein
MDTGMTEMAFTVDPFSHHKASQGQEAQSVGASRTSTHF